MRGQHRAVAVGHALLSHQQRLDRTPDRLHRGGLGAIRQQGHLHHPVACLDRLDQSGGDDVLARTGSWIACNAARKASVVGVAIS